MKEYKNELTLIVFAVGLVALFGCGGVKDDPDIVDKLHHEATNEGEGENEEPPDVSGDTIKFKPKSKDEEGDPDDDDE
ncbi:MAG: hypothetical protein QF685_09820 [Verrucomicrobiota bacterium]|nr:hypothetical protein [Verrucomicrobiota bacterium]